MDELMRKLEEKISFDEDSDDQDNTKKVVNDWDLLRKVKNGKVKTGNEIILLQNLQLETHIFKMALDFYNQSLDSLESKRIKYKNAIMCACVYMAFSINDYPREENNLFEYFKINKTQYVTGLKVVKSTISETRNIQRTFDNDLYHICNVLNIFSDIGVIRDFINNNYIYTLKYTKRTSSKSIKCAIIYIWLLTNKEIIPDIVSFSKICNISHKSISRIVYKNRFLYKNFFIEKIKQKTQQFITNLNITNVDLLLYDNFAENIISDLFKI